MTLYPVLRCMLYGDSYSFLRGWAAKFPDIGYDLLTGFFKKSWHPQRQLMAAWKPFISLREGHLVIDEIVLEKHQLGKLSIVKKRYKSAGGYVTPGISVVLLLWTDGKVRIPLGFRVRKPDDGTHIDAALSLLSWARNHLGCKPQWVSFDAGFCSNRLLKRIDDYGWAFICRIPRNRNFEGVTIRRFKKQGFWHACGELGNGMRVLAIRRKGKFYITNRLTWEANQVVERYRDRAVIEEVFRILKGLCHWGTCQLRSEARYERFLAMGTIAFIAWEIQRIRHPDPITIYEMRRRAILGDFTVSIPELEQLSLVS